MHVSSTGWDPFTQDGSLAYPFITVTQGYSEAWPGDRLVIDGGTYSESILLQKTMTIEPYPGESVVIGP